MLSLRKKLEGQSTSDDSLHQSGPRLMLSSEKSTTLTEDSNPVIPNTKQQTVAENTKENQEVVTKRTGGDTVAKRLPTFLRIQESLNRKLNSSASGAQSILAADNLESLAKMRPQTCPPNVDTILDTLNDKVNQNEKSVDNVVVSNQHVENVVHSLDTVSDTNIISQNTTDDKQLNTEAKGEASTDITTNAAVEGENLNDGTAEVVTSAEGVMVSTSNSLASGNTFGSDDLNRTVISQEESKVSFGFKEVMRV